MPARTSSPLPSGSGSGSGSGSMADADPHHNHASSSSAPAGPASTSTKKPPPNYNVLPPILPLSAFPETGTPRFEKPAGYAFYRDVLGSPKRIVAPMVAGSELPWRLLSREFGADLCYSPMINARSLVEAMSGKGQAGRRRMNKWFNVVNGEEGYGEDSMLIVQVAGDDPGVILKAAEHLQDHCRAIDLNLGCPQGIAKRGHYGSFLQEDWPLIFSIINTLHLNLRIPVTAKMRVFPDVERTVAYAKMLQHAGAQIVTVHGRTRDQKGHKAGLADWAKIRAVKEALHVPVFANGNVLYAEDVESALKTTLADGVMSAEGNLYTPTMFATPELRSTLALASTTTTKTTTTLFPHRSDGPQPRPEWAQFPYAPAVAHAYLDKVAQCRTETDHGAAKGHMFKIFRAALDRHTDARAMIGRALLRYDDARRAREARDAPEDEAREMVVAQYREAVNLLDEKLRADLHDSAFLTGPQPQEAYPYPDQRYIPHWLCQPYFRAPLPESEAPGPLREQDSVLAEGVARRQKEAEAAAAGAAVAAVAAAEEEGGGGGGGGGGAKGAEGEAGGEAASAVTTASNAKRGQEAESESGEPGERGEDVAVAQGEERKRIRVQ